MADFFIPVVETDDLTLNVAYASPMPVRDSQVEIWVESPFDFKVKLTPEEAHRLGHALLYMASSPPIPFGALTLDDMQASGEGPVTSE